MSYPATPTIWLEPTGQVAVGLRRYHTGGGFTCGDGYHEATVFYGVEPAVWHDRDEWGRTLAARPTVDHGDPRWPTNCARGCGYQFSDGDMWQEWQEQLYRRTDTGEAVTLRNRAADDPGDGPASAPPGAMWDAWWMPEAWHGPDGVALMVRLPDGHDWHVDGEASNCTRRGDRTHRCWIRHGDPRTGRVTVDKNGGETCAAGAGSIQTGGYHGFLSDGVLSAG